MPSPGLRPAPAQRCGAVKMLAKIPIMTSGCAFNPVTGLHARRPASRRWRRRQGPAGVPRRRRGQPTENRLGCCGRAALLDESGSGRLRRRPGQGSASRRGRSLERERQHARPGSRIQEYGNHRGPCTSSFPAARWIWPRARCRVKKKASGHATRRHTLDHRAELAVWPLWLSFGTAGREGTCIPATLSEALSRPHLVYPLASLDVSGQWPVYRADASPNEVSICPASLVLSRVVCQEPRPRS